MLMTPKTKKPIAAPKILGSQLAVKKYYHSIFGRERTATFEGGQAAFALHGPTRDSQCALSGVDPIDPINHIKH